jgi:hypothetical protein
MTHLKMDCRHRVCNVNTVNSILFTWHPLPPAVTLSLTDTLYSPLHLFVIVAVVARVASTVLLLVRPLHFDIVQI